jgi:hypothetical protein
MVELVGRVLRSNLRELPERTYDWLPGGDFASGGMAAFAKDVRRFSIQTASRREISHFTGTWQPLRGRFTQDQVPIPHFS